MSDRESLQDAGREQKRARFSEPERGNRKAVLLVVLGVAAVVGAVAYLTLSGMDAMPASKTATVASSRQPGAEPGRGAGDEVVIPLSELEGGKAKFYDFAASDRRNVRFFVIKSSDGVYRAALDACDVCFEAKKGYRQEGDEMVCKNCGNKFHSAQINEVSGGCNPVGLPRNVSGDSLIIRARDLESRKDYF